MREILGKAKTVRELLKGVKYSIDYYQREYKWHEKQIRELVDDLSDKFLEEYQPAHPRSKVADYPHYFLGSIIISKKDSVGYIVDGQQRLTSLTLLLVLLRNLQKDHAKQVNVDELIFSEKFDQKSFNLHVDERTPAMEALYAVNCLDHSDSIPTKQVPEHYAEFEKASPTFGRAFAYSLSTCSAWPVKSGQVTKAMAAEGAPPIVVIGTTRDPATPLAWAEALAGQLSSGVLITRDGDGHTGFNQGNECVDDAVHHYLLEGKSPKDGLTC